MKPTTEKAVRVTAVLAVVALIVGIALFSFPVGKGAGARDFSEFYAAAQMVRQGLGRNLYDLGAQARVQSKFASVQVFYNHPPFETLLFLPFTYVNYRAAYTLWTITSLGLLLGAALLIESHTKLSRAVSQFTGVHADFGLILIIFLTFAPVTTCLLLGQDSMLMLLIYALVFVLLKGGAEFRAGCVLAAGLFKFQLILPLVFILLLRRRWSTLAGFGGIASLLVLVSTAVSGLQVLVDYPRFLLFDSTYRQVAGFAPEFMPNFRGFLSLLLSGRIAGSILTGVVLTGSVLALWWAARGWRDEQLGLSFSASAIATLLASYHLYNYDLSLLLLPVAITCGELAQRGGSLSTPASLRAVLIVLFVPPLHRLLLLHSLYALMFIPIVVLFLTVIRLNRSSSDRALLTP